MSEIDRGDDLAVREAERAAAEAGAIGGRASSQPESGSRVPAEAERPLAEAGEGETEGFEQAEQELIEHAGHGDQHAALHAIEDATGEPDDSRATPGAEADHEYSSERADDR